MSKELEEACRVIAKFMGANFEWGHFLIVEGFIKSDKNEYASFNMSHKKRIPIKNLPYKNSLDELVPVWEKLEVITDFKFDIARSFREAKSEFILFNFTGSLKFKSYGETIQQAACLATAKAIMGLEK